MHPSFADLIVRFALAMGVVLGALALLARLARARLGRLGVGGGPSEPLAVLARRQIAKGTSLAVVRAGDKTLLVGVTPSSVTTLAELDPQAFVHAEDRPEEAVPTVPGGHWKALGWRERAPALAWMAKLDELRERTIRRG
jgi:flagellar biogenesis protein FliO